MDYKDYQDIIEATVAAQKAGQIDLHCELREVPEKAYKLAHAGRLYFFDLTPELFARCERNDGSLDWLDQEDMAECKSWRDVWERFIDGVYAVHVNDGILVCEDYMDYMQ